MPGITLQMATDRDSVALEIEGVDVVEGHVERRQDVFTYREVAVAGEFAVGNDQAEATVPAVFRNLQLACHGTIFIGRKFQRASRLAFGIDEFGLD